MEPIVASLTRHISKSEQGLYLRVPITIDAGIETITIKYEYTRHEMVSVDGGKILRKEVNIIDLALEDDDHRLIGASGSERREILIHENHATPGYRGCRITKGTWYLVLGAYLVQDDGCDVEITVLAQPKSPVLLKGETHCHTHHSDGWYTTQTVIDRARQDRLDYIFITDHNSMTSNDSLHSYPDLTVIPGVEVTYYNGHYNLYGIERPIKTYVANTRDEVLQIMHEGRLAGALLSINHPEDKGCGWKYGIGDDVPSDMVEIWNGPFTPYNQRSIDLWHSELCKGRIWPAIGGSDCHHTELFRTFGAPCTFLYSMGRSACDILHAMKSGHAFIGMNADAPLLYMTLGQALMGDVFEGEIGTENELYIRVNAVGPGDEIRIFNQNGMIYKHTPGACYQFEANVPIDDSLFVRMEVWRELPGLCVTLAAIGNPIYIRKSR